MRYAIELIFDQATEESLTDLIDGLEGAGIAPTLLDFDDRPHVTLGVFESDNPTDLMRRLKTLARTLSTVPLKFESVGFFQETGVVFLAPAPTRALLDLHRAVQKLLRPQLRKVPCANADYYAVDNLAFHTTLALRLKPPALLRAVKRMLGESYPHSVMGEALRLVVLPEGVRVVAQELALHPLGKARH